MADTAVLSPEAEAEIARQRQHPDVSTEPPADGDEGIPAEFAGPKIDKEREPSGDGSDEGDKPRRRSRKTTPTLTINASDLEHTVVDLRESDKPILTRTHLLGAAVNIREALDGYGRSPAALDAVYSLLVLAKDDLAAATGAMKQYRSDMAYNRDFEQMELVLR
jgi:hypothetical protein